MPLWEAVLRIIGALFSLAVVLFLAYAVLRWMNKRVPGLNGPVGNQRLIEVLDRVSAGRNSNIMLLRVQDKVILVAMSENSIEKLQEFDDPDRKISRGETPDEISFAAILKDAAAKTGFSLKEMGRKKPAGGGEGLPFEQADSLASTVLEQAENGEGLLPSQNGESSQNDKLGQMDDGNLTLGGDTFGDVLGAFGETSGAVTIDAHNAAKSGSDAASSEKPAEPSVKDVLAKDASKAAVAEASAGTETIGGAETAAASQVPQGDKEGGASR